MSRGPRKTARNACAASRLKFYANAILSNLTKNRVAFASNLLKNVASSPTTASRLPGIVCFKGGEKPAGDDWDRVMFFLLRMVFWLGLVCLLLPSGGSKTNPDAQINATQAVTLASAAVSDMRGFCDRQPTACKVGGKVAVALGHKAEDGARTIISFVTAKMSEQTGSVQKIADAKTAGKTAGKTAPRVVAVSTIDHGTLKPSDLAPAWHVKVPLPPRREVPRGRPSV
jgi:hypothetical protein